jgi:hypothetical protein
LVSVVAIVLSLLALPLSSRRMTFQKIAFAFCLLIIHISTTLVYFRFSLSHAADTAIYYYDLWHFNSKPWTSLSTVFVVHLTQLLRQSFGATYFDCFMVFQTAGFAGIMMLSRTFEEIHARIGVTDTRISRCLLLLPTIHYWTSAIGKDGILFLAITLCVWSALNLSRRFVWFGLALALMVSTRVHIALVVVASLSIAASFYPRLSLGRRLGLLAPAAMAIGVLALVVRTSLGVNLANADSIANFLAEKSAGWQVVAGSGSIYGDSYSVKLASLLVRPMFVDTRNLLGIVASIENLFLLAIILTCAVHWRQLLELYRKVLFVRFALWLTIGLILLIAIGNYNVGLGLRQRTMFFPPLLAIFVSIWAYGARLKSDRRPFANAALVTPFDRPATAPVLEKRPGFSRP